MRLLGTAEYSKPALHQLQKCQGKPDIGEEIVLILRRVLRCCLWCLTCGCYSGLDDEEEDALYGETELTEEERCSVQCLLQYLDMKGDKPASISESRLQALCVLTYSDNVELQRSAALCFAEISRTMEDTVTEISLEPLIALLRSRDMQVQRAASLAISNYAVQNPCENRRAIVNADVIRPLVLLLYSEHVDVQCNVCGSITSLATDDRTKQQVVCAGGIPPLLDLAKSRDVRVQRNATGSLLNLSQLDSVRDKLIAAGLLPLLVSLLHSPNSDVLFYCVAAINNMSVNKRHRTMVVAVGHYDCLRRLIKLMSTATDKVTCQVCLALRNIASEDDNQKLLVQLGCLSELLPILHSSRGETLVAATACLRNLSIHMGNEEVIIRGSFLTPLKRIVKNSSNVAAQIHAAGIIRNLSAGDHIQDMIDGGCVEALVCTVEQQDSQVEVLAEVTAALAVLTDEESAKTRLLACHEGHLVERLVSMATETEHTELAYTSAGIIGQLSLSAQAECAVNQHCSALLRYIHMFLNLDELRFVHIALWTCVQLLQFDIFNQQLQESEVMMKISQLCTEGSTEVIRELANSTLQKTSIC